MDYKELQNLIRGVTTFVLLPERQRIQTKIDDIINQNYMLNGSTQRTFYFDGKYFGLPITAKSRKDIKNLDASLAPQMSEIMHELKRVDYDEGRMKQGLTIILAKCNTRQDIRDALPEYVVMRFEALNSLPRFRPEGYTVKDNPMKYKQYLLLKEKIDFYIALELLY